MTSTSSTSSLVKCRLEDLRNGGKQRSTKSFAKTNHRADPENDESEIVSVPFYSYFREIEELKEMLQNISTASEDMHKWIPKITRENSEATLEEMFILMANADRLATKVLYKLKEFDSHIKRMSEGTRYTESRMKRLQFLCVGLRFLDSLRILHLTIEKYANELKAYMQYDIICTCTKLDNKDLERIIEEKSTLDNFMQHILDHQSEGGDVMDRIISWKKEILLAEYYMKKLEDCFGEVSQFSQLQNDLYDQVEYSVTIIKNYVPPNNNHATTNSTEDLISHRRKLVRIARCLYFLLFVIVVSSYFFVIYFTVSHGLR